MKYCLKTKTRTSLFQKLATLGGQVKENAEAEAQNEVESESESETRELRSKEGRGGRNASQATNGCCFDLAILEQSIAAAVNLSKRAHEEVRRARTRTNYASSPEAKEGQSDREQLVEEEAGGEMDEVQRKSGARNRELPAPTSVFDLSLLPKRWCKRQRQMKHDQALSGKKRNFGGKAKISIAAERIVNGQVHILATLQKNWNQGEDPSASKRNSQGENVPKHC